MKSAGKFIVIILKNKSFFQVCSLGASIKISGMCFALPRGKKFKIKCIACLQCAAAGKPAAEIFILSLLFNNIGAHKGDEKFRNTYSPILVLEVFEDGGNCPSNRKS